MSSDQSGIQLEMNFNIPSGNRFRRCLEHGVFNVLFEHAAPGKELVDDEAARRLALLEKAALECRDLPCALAITDHYRSDNGRSAVEYAALLPEKNRNSHIFYLSGRNRTADQLRGLTAEAVQLGLSNLVAVSGDSRESENVRDLRKINFTESVQTLDILRQSPSRELFFPGCTVNPHLYSAPGLYAGLFKLIKKFNTGAEFAVTQAGFDMAQLDALRTYLSWRNYHHGLIARLMLLTPEKVEKITAGAYPGIRMSEDFLAILNKELRFSDSQFEAAQYRRLELQAAGCKLLGFSGIQISGADSAEKIRIVSGCISRALKEFTSLAQWIDEYNFYMARSDMARADEHFYMFKQLLNAHTVSEDASPQLTEFTVPPWSMLQKIGDSARRFLFPEADQQAPEQRRWLKKMLANCQSCHNCRLPQTQFRCPEQCPKHLFNGPCGGVRDNGRCEVGNQECVHLNIWRSAELRKECHTLENGVIGAINQN